MVAPAFAGLDICLPKFVLLTTFCWCYYQECRAKNIDELYYAAVITGYDETRDTYSVAYEDSTSDCGLFRSSMLVPNQQRHVFNDETIKIFDGHAWLKGGTHPARFMSFNSSPQLVQSAVVIKETAAQSLSHEQSREGTETSAEVAENADTNTKFDHSVLVFDVDQALVLVLKKPSCRKTT